MSDSVSKNKAFSNLIWNLAQRFGAQLVSLIVSIILARILMPEVYGTVAIVTVFLNILMVFVDSGLGVSLIQKKDADDIDFSTVFYFNLATCCTLYLGLFFCAPLIAAFYSVPELVPIIRVIGLLLVLSGLRNIQQAYVSRNMLFKKMFYSTLGGVTASAVVGITLAYSGYGVWALVAQQLTNSFVDTVILWITVKWRPQKVFSLHRLKRNLSYGWKILASSLLESVYSNIRQLIIGRMYTTKDLAFYNKGKQFPELLLSNLNSAINSVLFPVMSKSQDDRAVVKRMTRKSIRMSNYVVWPLMVGLAAVAEPFIRIVLTEKWLFCVPYMRIYCIVFALYPIHTANLNAIKAIGRSDVYLKLEIIKKIVGVFSIIVTVRYGVLAIAVGAMVVGPIGAVINAYPNVRLLGYTYKEQLLDVIPYILMSIIMGVCVLPIQLMPVPPIFVLFLQVIVGALIYIVESMVFKVSTFYDCVSIIRSIAQKKKA